MRAEEYARGMVTGGTLFEEMGFHYVGPIDGHNLDHLIPVLKNVRDAEDGGPVLVHIVTQKKARAIAPAVELRGQVPRRQQVRCGDRRAGQEVEAECADLHVKVFANAHGSQERRKGRQSDCRDQRRHAVGDRSSTSLRQGVSRPICFDVGIAEQHASDLCRWPGDRGLCAPFAAIYSTFLQRAYDQVVHDVAIQTIAGALRHRPRRIWSAPTVRPIAGAFDIDLPRSTLPDFVVMAAADEAELDPYGGDSGSDRRPALRLPLSAG